MLIMVMELIHLDMRQAEEWLMAAKTFRAVPTTQDTIIRLRKTLDLNLERMMDSREQCKFFFLYIID